MSLRLTLIKWLWPKKGISSGTCANRRWWSFTRGPVEVTLTMRHMGIPDGYSREELLEMLHTVRKHEKIQGWKVPEPKE